MSNRNIFAVTALAGLFFVAGQFVASEPQRIKEEAALDREITVSGFGEVSSRPDVARITLGVQTGPQPTAERALAILSERFEGVVDAVTDAGVEEDDVKTSQLSVQPVYDFREGERILRGFEATESIEVTIRQLDTIGDVLALSVFQGVNQASGVSFEIDDPTQLQLQAQEAAIANARENAQALAKALGVRLGDVKTFAAQAGGEPTPAFARAELSTADEGIAGPPVPVGTSDVTATVQVTFALQ